MESPILTDAQAEAWLRLNALEFMPKRAQSLLDAYDGDPTAIWAASRSDWKERCPGLTNINLARLAEIRDQDLTKEMTALKSAGAHIVAWNDPRYPANLRQLPDAPPVLLVRGELVPEDKFSIAIVGSRRATSYGLQLARRFASDLTARGLTVVSGGARGVDTLSHQGALDGGGRTIAFLGCGVDVPYPADNRKLFAEIADGRGAVLSEFPMGTKPEPWRFPARNRLISGTSLEVCSVTSPNSSDLKNTSAPLLPRSPLRGITFSMTVPRMSRLAVPGTWGEVSASRTSESMPVKSICLPGAALPAFGFALTDFDTTPRRSSKSLRRPAIPANTSAYTSAEAPARMPAICA